MKDLDLAVKLFKEVVKSTPSENIARSNRLNMLEMGFKSMPLKPVNGAVDRTPVNYPDRPGRL